MKRVFWLALIFTLAFPLMPEAGNVPTVHITETTPVYSHSQKVGVFQKGISASIVKESDRYYHTVIGGEEVKFSKKRAVKVNDSYGSTKGAYPVRGKTTKNVRVLNAPTPRANEIGLLQPTMKIQLQRAKGDYYPINFGGKTGYINKKDIVIDSGIPVLMYHDLTKVKQSDNLSVLEVKNFEEQMAYLKKNNWTTITPRQLELWVQGKLNLPAKSVLITFDDGYESTIQLGYPILKRHGLKATSFLITSRIGKPGMVSEYAIRSTTDVYSYQNHTHAYHMFNSLNGLSYLQSESRFAIRADLREANETIEDILSGHKVTAHAYPYGKSSPQAVLALKDAGINIAFTIEEGNVHRGDPIYALNRQRVHSHMSLKDFADKLKGM
ncbi:polysaccharide deacetylase family protein [Sporosarcina sp. 179-K 8C2 HS]|uniref:polysaccharide deacetylase family protein n=1 Tax=Sporosarcina sp. 179-K 8C2 HS TaxID=3142387 RepID=UPI0039A0DF0F